MTSPVRHYEVLGLQQDASAEQIKAAYKRLALREHPDRHGGDRDAEDRFKGFSQAFSVLSDPKQRIRYDAELLATRGARQLVSGFVQDVLAGFGRRRSHGRDLRYRMTVSLEQIAAEHTEVVSFPVELTCRACDGVGGKPDKLRQCDDCTGNGVVRGEGLLGLPVPCPGCGGQRVRTSEPCDGCEGVGQAVIQRSYEVTLPAGIRDGQVHRLVGQGQPGTGGGRDGDLYVHVRVKTHPIFTRSGRNLTLRLPVDLSTMALGGTVSVKTLDSLVRVVVPEGTDSGTVLRVKGKGLLVDSQRGDLLVTLVVETPKALTDAQRGLVERLRRELGDENYPQGSCFRKTLGSSGIDPDHVETVAQPSVQRASDRSSGSEG